MSEYSKTLRARLQEIEDERTAILSLLALYEKGNGDVVPMGRKGIVPSTKLSLLPVGEHIDGYATIGDAQPHIKRQSYNREHLDILLDIVVHESGRYGLHHKDIQRKLQERNIIIKSKLLSSMLSHHRLHKRIYCDAHSMWRGREPMGQKEAEEAGLSSAQG